MARRVAFVGPLPPPVHGFSYMCSLMLQRFKERTLVEVFDRAPSPVGTTRSIYAQARELLRYAASCARPGSTALYLALSGGRGQLIDLIYVLMSRVIGRGIIVHHHSFSYITSSSWLNRCFFACVRNETHIVLTPGMGAALTRRYRLNGGKIRVVSNAAFFRGDIGAQTHARAAGQEIKIGYLSNITFEKGFVEFFDILLALRRQGVRFKATIAGPIAASAKERFESLLSADSQTEYVGPLYGAAKEDFYRQLDVFVFPTKYLNEAEPLVIYEAMNASAYVVASDRGGIREMVGEAGLVASEGSIVERAAERIQQLSLNPEQLVSAQEASLHRAQRVSAEAVIALEDFLDYTVA